MTAAAGAKRSTGGARLPPLPPPAHRGAEWPAAVNTQADEAAHTPEREIETGGRFINKMYSMYRVLLTQISNKILQSHIWCFFLYTLMNFVLNFLSLLAMLLSTIYIVFYSQSLSTFLPHIFPPRFNGPWFDTSITWTCICYVWCNKHFKPTLPLRK